MAVVAIVVFAFVGCARYGTERATQVEYGGASAGKIAHNIVQQSCFNVGVLGSGGRANNNEGHTPPIATSRDSCGNLQVPSTFADDERMLAAGIDPNIVHQPDIVRRVHRDEERDHQRPR